MRGKWYLFYSVYICGDKYDEKKVLEATSEDGAFREGSDMWKKEVAARASNLSSSAQIMYVIDLGR